MLNNSIEPEIEAGSPRISFGKDYGFTNHLRFARELLQSCKPQTTAQRDLLDDVGAVIGESLDILNRVLWRRTTRNRTKQDIFTLEFEGPYDDELEAFGGIQEMTSFYESQLQEELNDNSLRVDSVCRGSIIVKGKVSHAALGRWVNLQATPHHAPLRLLEKQVVSLEIEGLCRIDYPTPYLLNWIASPSPSPEQSQLSKPETKSYNPVRDPLAEFPWMRQYIEKGWSAKPNFIEILKRIEGLAMWGIGKRNGKIKVILWVRSSHYQHALDQLKLDFTSDHFHVEKVPNEFKMVYESLLGT